MKFFKKKAKFVGYVVYNDDKLREWRCPKCGMSIGEDYVCCPYCGQAVKFPTLPEDEINNFIKKEMAKPTALNGMSIVVLDPKSDSRMI